MSFHHLDQFSHVTSPVTRVPPAGRVAATVLLAVVTATLPAGAWVAMGVMALLSVGLLRAAGIPTATAVSRLAWPLGLVLIASAGLLVMVPGRPLLALGPLAVTDAGAGRFATVVARAMVALLPAVVLVSTTSFPELLHGLRQLRLPSAVATALGLAYRLLYLTVDELERLQRAARSRNAGQGAAGRRSLLVAVVSATLGRAFTRAERTHAAMLSRGYRGTLPLLHTTPWTRAAAVQVGAVSLVALGAAVLARAA